MNTVSAVIAAKINPWAQPPIQMTISSLVTNAKMTHRIIEIVKQHEETVARPSRWIASPTDRIAKMHGISPPKFDFHVDDAKML